MEPVSHSFPSFDNSCIKAATQSLYDGDFSGIVSKEQAEHSLSCFMGTDYARLTSSGFHALQAALIAIGVKLGSKVIIPTVTCPSVYHAVVSVGAIPVVVDVGSDVPLIAEENVRDLSLPPDEKYTFIIPQMFGLSRNLEEFPSHFNIIEDLAQRFTPYISSSAEMGVVSFSPTKLLTMGYGGAVVSNNRSLMERVSHFLDPDHTEYTLFDPGTVPFRVHSSVSGFQCAILLAQLKRYKQVIKARAKLVEAYDMALGDPERLQPEVPFRYQLILRNGSAPIIAERLRERGIMAYPLGSQLLHNVFSLDGKFDNAEKWYQTILSLPLHENLTIDIIQDICFIVRRLLL
ncbi:MAG: DegT/DnrJ/EryC1/StrS family aminotransferase [Brevibacillus sp.]|nr:DegT/DnrJ/EryC1/StrS family aminotransferase [Brevibacillus sp.]